MSNQSRIRRLSRWMGASALAVQALAVFAALRFWLWPSRAASGDAAPVTQLQGVDLGIGLMASIAALCLLGFCLATV